MDLMKLMVRIGADTSEAEKGIQKTQTLGGKLSSGLKTVAKVGAAAIAGATTAVVAFTKSSVDAGMRFDASMSNVAAISGATGKDLEDLRNKAQEMGAKTKFSASEAADAFSYMAMAGWKTGDMLDGIEGVMNLAAASGEDLARTSDIVTDALTAFGLKAEDSSHFADILAAASSNANTNVGLMGETFKYVAPVAGSLGLKAEEVSVAIGLMANAGIKGSQAGTSLRSILTRLVAPTKQSQNAMNALGIEVTNADGSMKSMKEIMDMLRSKFGDLTEAQQAEFASMLAGKNAMSGLLAVVNASEEDYDKLTTAIDNCDGAAEKMAATMQDNLAGDITIFKSALEGAQIALSDQLTPSLREFVQFGTKAVADLTKAFREDGLDGVLNALENIVTNGIALLMQYLPKFIKVGAAVLKAVVKGIIDNMPLIIDGAKEIVNALIEGLVESVPLLNAFGAEGVKAIIGGIAAALTAGKVISTISGFITMFKGIATSITAAGGLIPALSAMISPIGLVVAAIGAAVAVGVLLYKNWDTIKEAASNVVEAIKTAWENIKTLGTNLVNNIKTGITEKAKDLVQGAKDLAGKVSESIKTKWENVKTLGSNLIAKIKNGIAEKKKDIITGASDLAKKVKESFSSKWESAKTIGGNLIAYLAQGVADKASKLSEIISKIVGGIGDYWGKFVEACKTYGSGIIANLGNGIVSKVQDLYDLYRNIIQNIFDSIKNVIESAKSWGSGLMTSFINGVIEKFNSLGDKLRQVGQMIKDFLHFSQPDKGPLSGPNGFESYAPDMMKTFAKGITDNADYVKKAINRSFDFGDRIKGFGTGASDLAKEVKESFSSKWESAKTIGGNLIAKIKSGIAGEKKDIITGASDLAKEVKESFSSKWESAKTIGGNLIAKISSGIAEKKKDIITGTSDLAKKVKESFSAEIKNVIKSAKNWGSGFMQSFINGIVGKFNALVGKLRDIGSAIRDYLHFSQPDKGPLSGPNGFESYAPDMMKSFAKGITDNADYVTNAISRSFDFGDQITGFGNSATRRGADQGDVIPRGAAQTVGGTVRNMTTILQLDRYTLGRVVYELYNEEKQRVGVKLAGGTV